MRYPYFTADVFTDRPFCGNPLAVFTDARGLDDATMQRIAAELNLSETVFVLPPEHPAHTARLRIFTPRAEVDFAGHPTVGTACVLVQTGAVELDPQGRRELVFGENVGAIEVLVCRDLNGGIEARLAAAQLPEVGPTPPDNATLAAMLGLPPEAIAGAPRALSCGLRFLCVPIASRDALAGARLDPALWRRDLADFWAPQLFLYTRDSGEAGIDLRARMFAPALGIAEDPATGSAVAALAGDLAARDPRPDATLRWHVLQGVEMGRPSLLLAETRREAGKVTAIHVGGNAVLMSEGWLSLPTPI